MRDSAQMLQMSQPLRLIELDQKSLTLPVGTVGKERRRRARPRPGELLPEDIFFLALW